MVARLQAATKNANATLLLMRVIFWSKQKNGGVELEGHRWVVNALEEWADETGLTRHQVKEAIAALREMNLVATKMAWWHNRWVMHSRLTPRTTAILEGGSAPIGAGGQCQMAPGVSANWHSTYIQGESQGDSFKESSELTLANAITAPEENLDAGEENDMKKVKSVHEVFDAVKAQKFDHKPDSVKALEFMWKAKVAELTGQTIILKAKELGQLKHFRSVCPAHKAEIVLSRVLDKWVHFAKTVQGEVGLHSTPSNPNIDFLLKYASIAVTFAAPSKKIVAKKEEAPPAIVVPKIVQLIASDEDKPATLEEVLAITKEG